MNTTAFPAIGVLVREPPIGRPSFECTCHSWVICSHLIAMKPAKATGDACNKRADQK